MEISVLEEKENPFFKRKEIKISLKHEKSATPSKAEIVKSLASSNPVDESQVVVDYILTKKGYNESVAKIKILKEKPPKPIAKEEKPAEQKPEEKKVEEKKVDVKKDRVEKKEGEKIETQKSKNE